MSVQKLNLSQPSSGRDYSDTWGAEVRVSPGTSIVEVLIYSKTGQADIRSIRFRAWSNDVELLCETLLEAVKAARTF